MRWGLLLLRIVVGAIFIYHGVQKLQKPGEYAKNLEFPVWLAFLLGLGEVLSALSVILGIYTQLGALVMMIIMLGAMGYKVFKWKAKFFDGTSGGWHYDLILFAAALVIFAVAGGPIVLGP